MSCVMFACQSPAYFACARTDLRPQNSLEQDAEYPHVVTEYLTTYFGYHIDLMVGHCRGTILVRWLCTTGEGKPVSGFENVSGRYRMRVSVLPCSQ